MWVLSSCSLIYKMHYVMMFVRFSFPPVKSRYRISTVMGENYKLLSKNLAFLLSFFPIPV